MQYFSILSFLTLSRSCSPLPTSNKCLFHSLLQSLNLRPNIIQNILVFNSVKEKLCTFNVCCWKGPLPKWYFSLPKKCKDRLIARWSCTNQNYRQNNTNLRDFFRQCKLLAVGKSIQNISYYSSFYHKRFVIENSELGWKQIHAIDK